MRVFPPFLSLVLLSAVFRRFLSCPLRYSAGSFLSALFVSCWCRYSGVLFCPVGAGIPAPFSIPRYLLRDAVHRHEPVTLAFVRDIAHFSRYFLLNIRAIQYLFIRLNQQQFPLSTSFKIDPLRFEELVVWTIRLRESFR